MTTHPNTPPRVTAALLASAAILASIHAARAGDLAYTYIGVVASISDEKGLLADAVAPGDPFALAARFTHAEPDTNPDPIWGLYESAAPASAPRLTLSLPGLSLTAPTATAAVADNLAAPPPNPPLLDIFRIESSFDTIALGRHFAFFVQLLLLDETASALSSAALPTRASTDPARFAAAAQLIITGAVVGEPGQFTIIAAVTALPSPGALALLTLAPLATAPRRRNI